MKPPPDYRDLTRGEAATIPEEDKIPAVFDRDRFPAVRGQRGGAVFKPGHQIARHGVSGAVKKTRLRDQLAQAFAGPGDRASAVKMAAYAVGCDEKDVPEEARETLASLTAWVFAMRAVGGSVEHFREIGDRVDPKPKRLEIEGVSGARRGGVGSNADEAAEADAYYKAISGEIVDAVYTTDEDLSFLD